MGADVLDVERAADHGFQRVIGGVALRDVELGVARSRMRGAKRKPVRCIRAKT